MLRVKNISILCCLFSGLINPSMRSLVYAQPVKSTIATSLCVAFCHKSTGNCTLSELCALHKKQINQVVPIFNQQSMQDLTRACLMLQQKLNFPRIVPVIFNGTNMQSLATYHADKKGNAIEICNMMHTVSLSQKIGVLLHELRHAQQNLPDFKLPYSLQQFQRDYHLSKRQIDERDADLFAADCFKCRSCLIMWQLLASKNWDPAGYARCKDYEPYISQAIQFCKAHSGKNNDTLQEIFNQKKIKDKKISQLKLEKNNKNFARAMNYEKFTQEITEADNSMGTLFDRIPPLKK